MSLKKIFALIVSEYRYALQVKSNIIFFPVFLSFFVFLFVWPQNISAPITDFSKTIIGVSTLNNVDVSNRVTLFYRGFLYAVFVLIVSNYLFNKLYEAIKHAKTEFKALNMLSVLAILNLIAGLPEFEFLPGLKLLLWLMGILVIIIIVGAMQSSFRKICNSQLTLGFIFSLNISICLQFIGLNETGSFFLLSFLLITVFILIYSKIVTFERYKQHLYYLLGPIFLLPLIILAQETFFIFNHRQWIHIHPRFWFIFFLIVLHIVLYFIGSKQTFTFNKFKRIYLPASVLGIILFITYTPLTSAPAGLFEMSNQANTLMMLFKFNEWPVIDFLGIHLLSDVFYGTVYFLFNGYNGSMDYLAYKFLYNFFLLSVGFLLLKKISGNSFFGLTYILFFPFLNIFLWSNSAWVVYLIPFALYYVYTKPGLLSYLTLIMISLLQASWKPDTGFASLIATVVGVIVILFMKRQVFKLNLILKSVGIFIVASFIILIFIFFVFDKSLSNIPAALSFYSTSIQARGLSKLALEFNRYFSFHHIIVPFLLLVTVFFILNHFSKEWKKKPFLYFTLMVFLIVYLANFQRGLTRHNFAEGSDWNLASYSYLTLSLMAFVLKIAKNRKIILFIIISGFSIYFLKYPSSPKANPYISGLIAQSQQLPIHKSARINRVEMPDEVIKKDVNPIKKFFRQNLNSDETFYDFSNTPGLYYYLQKKPPQYFAHSIAISNDMLQAHQIQILENNNVPYVIYSHIPRTWWDDTDGVPNEVRFYLIAEYLFQNYKPDTTIGNYFIWKKKSLSRKPSTLHKPQHFNLRYLPMLMGYQGEAQNFNRKVYEGVNDKKFMKLDSENSCPSVLHLQILNPVSNAIAKVQYYNSGNALGSYSFIIEQCDTLKTYKLRLSMQYNWFAGNPDSIRVILPLPEIELEHIQLKSNCETRFAID